MIIINTVENSLIDLEKKGNLDIAFDSYNPNRYFEKVYHITYNPNDLDIITKNNIEIICPFYFKLLYKLKNKKILKIMFYPFVYIFHIMYLTCFINSKRIDIARGRMPYLMSYALGIASKINGIPFVVSLGGDNRLAQDKIGRYHLFNNRWLSFFIEEKTINISNCVIVPNVYTKKYVKNISTQKNIKINPLPIRKSFFEEKNKFHYDREDYFLYIGRFVGDKHPDFVVSVFHDYIIKNNDNKTRLKMIGDGPLLAQLKKQVESFKIQDRVDFLGFLQSDDIKQYLQKAKVSLIPISGFVIYEAAVFLNPIITSDIEWHSEFIADGKNGWVCKYLDVAEWSNKLLEIINNYNNTLKISSNLQYSIDSLHPINILNKDIEIYNTELKK